MSDQRLLSPFAVLMAGLAEASRADASSADTTRADASLNSRAMLERLESLLERAGISGDGSGAVGHVAPLERATLARETAERGGEYRVYRRESPISSPFAPLTTPDWARGAAIAETVGPLRALDGRIFWFDFFRVVRLVPVFFAGDAQPAFLFSFRERRFGFTDILDVRDILGFFSPLALSNSYAMEQGSVWVRADLLAPAAPAGSYIGLSVRGGTLTFTPRVSEEDGRLTISPGGRCAIHLDLSSPAEPPGAVDAGRDAATASVTLPASCDIELAFGAGVVTQLADARWTVYGQSISFVRRANAAPYWEPTLLSVVVPYDASERAIALREVQSPFATLEGRARITRAGWTLPVATIDVTNPSDAAGAGGLAVQTERGLSIGWRGLRNGPVVLETPWLSAAPGLLVVNEQAAQHARATQRFRLWQESSPPGRSTIDLRYDVPGQLTYIVSAAGSELLFVRPSSTAALDRPVDVQRESMAVHTLRSLLALSYTDTQRLAMLYDDDVLMDALDPDAPWQSTSARVHAIAIRNALFTTTPVNSLLLFASLRDDEMIERGTVMLGMGLYTLLPTLPDPYAANVSVMRRGGRLDRRNAAVSQLLVAAVTWGKSVADDDPDAITTSFAFAPVGTQAASIARWDAATSAALSFVGEGVSATFNAAGEESPRAMMRSGRRPTEPIWESLFQQFGDEQFALLDVSSNADQMGVSFAWFDPRRVGEQGSPFATAFGNGEPSPVSALEVRDLSLSAQGRFVRAFTVPQISWDPFFNLTPPQRPGDPPGGYLLHPNDGGPTRLLNDDTAVLPIEPIPVTTHIAEDLTTRTAPTAFTGALFTLPYGLRAFAEFSRQNQLVTALGGARVALNQPTFEAGVLKGGLQLRADAPPQPNEDPLFRGCTAQMENLHLYNGAPTNTGTLGASVGVIFNQEFFLDGASRVRNRGVPLTRIDFSGYGASIFSHWQNPNAAIASTSQARFDVFVGRTSTEVIQVRSLLYPWGIRVVRTITLFRASSAYTYRTDSGWQPESDGEFDFSYRVQTWAGPDLVLQDRPSPFEFHPCVVRGVFNIRNIRETDKLVPFTGKLSKANGETYVDQDNIEQVVDGSTPLEERDPEVELVPVFFDGDFQLDGVIAGATAGRVPSQGILGYVQLKPRGEPLTAVAFRQLLQSQMGSIGGALACELDVAASGQRMRVARVDVSTSVNGAGDPIFVVAPRGPVVLPTGGAWSVVVHAQGSGEISPLDPNAAVPLIRRGVLNPATRTTDATPADLFRFANPIDLVRGLQADSRNFGLLQTTGTQKALFRLPSFQQGVDELMGAAPDFADAYRLLNTKGIFPNIQDAVPLVLGAFRTRIIDEGYRLLDAADPGRILEQVLPEGPLFLVNESFLKIYVEYSFAKNDKTGTAARPGLLQFGLDSAAAEGKKWLSGVNDIGMVVDLGAIKRLVTIKGSLDAKHGEAPGFRAPEMVFADELQPVVDILQILSDLQGGDYKSAMQKGLDVAMSNSAGSWNYAFHARKEFPCVQFPPGDLYNAPQTPLKLRAHFAVGAYFNESIAPTTDPKQLIPTAGAYLEFGGSLSVMCLTVGAATVYAVGSVDLRVSGDTKTGPGLAMKFGFGCELIVGLPVVGNVSLLYMVGVEVSMDLTQITVSAFLLFRGRAELLGGIVTITIQIEAKGSYQRIAGPPAVTNMKAQVTFAIDISIFLIINLHFSQSWQEQRQIA